MATEVRLPPIAADTHEGTLQRWLVIPGTAVEKGDLIAEIETAKTVFEVEAPCAGTLLATVAQRGAELVVGQLMGWIGAPDEDVPAVHESDKQVPAGTPPTPAIDLPDKPIRPRIRATPVVLRLAVEQGVDITTVTGSGPNGRITRDDVERAAKTTP